MTFQYLHTCFQSINNNQNLYLYAVRDDKDRSINRFCTTEVNKKSNASEIFKAATELYRQEIKSKNYDLNSPELKQTINILKTDATNFYYDKYLTKQSRLGCLEKISRVIYHLVSFIFFKTNKFSEAEEKTRTSYHEFIRVLDDPFTLTEKAKRAFTKLSGQIINSAVSTLVDNAWVKAATSGVAAAKLAINGNFKGAAVLTMQGIAIVANDNFDDLAQSHVPGAYELEKTQRRAESMYAKADENV